MALLTLPTHNEADVRLENSCAPSPIFGSCCALVLGFKTTRMY